MNDTTITPQANSIEIDDCFLSQAVGVLNRKFYLYQQSRRFREAAIKTEKKVVRLEGILAANDFYFCQSCGKWYSGRDMAKKETPLGSNKCSSCSEEYYFELLAKANICNGGISLTTAPQELIEIEKLRAKTRFVLKGGELITKKHKDENNR